MSDTTGYPQPRCGEYVSGGITSYPCWLPQGHDGPHAAVEVQSSINSRAMWEAAQKLTPKQGYASFAPPSPPINPGDLPWTPSLRPSDVVPGEQRERELLKAIERAAAEAAPNAFPEPMLASMRGSTALTSLGVLWHLAQKEFERGASAVMVSREFLESAVPPMLKEFYSALSRQEKQG